MPTRDVTESFWQDYRRLTPEQTRLFRTALAHFIDDLQEGRPFRPGLRVHRVRGQPGVWEMTWARMGVLCSDMAGVPHIVWLRIGTHTILDNR